MRLIDGDALELKLRMDAGEDWAKDNRAWLSDTIVDCADDVQNSPTIKAYTITQVASILSCLFNECPCNINDIDEWLPERCEYADNCPNGGTACWEQYLKNRWELP